MWVGDRAEAVVYSPIGEEGFGDCCGELRSSVLVDVVWNTERNEGGAKDGYEPGGAVGRSLDDGPS